MKKIILCLLLVAALVFAFAACGSKNDPQGDDGTTESLTTSAPESTEAPTTEAPSGGENIGGNEFANDNEAIYPDSWN